MNFKLVAIVEVKKDYLIRPLSTNKTVGKNNYVMKYEFDFIEMSKIRDFFILENVLKNGEPYRFMHTAHILQSFYFLGGFLEENTPEESYKNFIEGRKKAGEEYISLENFLVLRELTNKVASSNFDSKFFAYLLATHDIGCISGESRHFIRSGEMSKPRFKELGYNEDYCEIARIINGNHSLLGDILIGEGTPDYAISIYDKLSELSLCIGKPADYGWKLLFLLNALDVHSAYNGFLTEKKVQELHQLQDREALLSLKNSWGISRQKLLGIVDSSKDDEIDHHYIAIFFNKVSQYFQTHHPHITLIPDVNSLYMQYCYDRIRDMNMTDSRIFLNKLAVVDHLIKQLTDNQHFCITFKSGKDHNMDRMVEFISNDFFVECVSVRDKELYTHDGLRILFQGYIGEFYFEITDDGYLEIDDVRIQN